MPNPMQVAQANLGMDPDYDADGEMTVVQASKLRALCDELGEEFDTSLTQKQAMNRIIALEEQRDG